MPVAPSFDGKSRCFGRNRLPIGRWIAAKPARAQIEEKW
jgi:hypothetical protein